MNDQSQIQKRAMPDVETLRRDARKHIEDGAVTLRVYTVWAVVGDAAIGSNAHHEAFILVLAARFPRAGRVSRTSSRRAQSR